MSKKTMVKMFNDLSYRHQLWEVFSDFLQMVALAISNSCDFKNWNRREEEYKQIINKYTKDEQMIFPKLYGELVMTMEEEGFNDILGEIFMELELGNKWKGQFFTPYNLCKLTARVALGNIDKIMENQKYISLNEPCSGGGAMIIAVAEIMKAKGYNPQQQLKVICQDLDIKAVYMTYIQLSLYGIPATVCHANTLSLEVFDVFYTPFWILGGWNCRKNEKKQEYKIKLTEEENGQLRMI